MANNSYYDNPANAKYTGKFEVYENTRIPTNDNVITWYFKLYRNDNVSSSYSRKEGNHVVLMVDGQQIFSTTDCGTVVAPNGEASAYTLASGSFTLPHNEDGKRAFDFSITYTNDYSTSIGPLTVSDTHVCTDIPRVSTISVPDFIMGSPGTINISRASDSFTHNLSYVFGSSLGMIATDVGDKVTWTPEASELGEYMPDSPSATGTINCFTYDRDGNLVGKSSKPFKLSINKSMKPTIGNLIIERIDGAVPSSWGIYVEGQSKATLTITGAKGCYGSTIEEYQISGEGYSVAKNSLTTDYLRAGKKVFTAKVRDSREVWSDEMTITIDVVEYSSPKIISVKTYRCDEDGNRSDDGNYFWAQAEFEYSDCGGKNQATCTAFYRKTTDTIWLVGGELQNGIGAAFGKGGLNPEGSYDVEYELEDTFKKGDKAVIYPSYVSSTYFLVHFKRGGLGLAIGKTAEEDYLFDVNMDTLFRKLVRVVDRDGEEYVVGDQLKTIWEKFADYLPRSGGADHPMTGSMYFENNVNIWANDADRTPHDVFEPKNSDGNTVIGWSNYDKKTGDTMIFGHDVWFGVSNIASPNKFRPYYRQGEGYTLGTLATSGFVTNEGKDVYFILPVTKYIVGSPAISITSVDGFILRQGGNYTHGSGATTWVKPDSYEEVLLPSNCIRIKATFRNTANVINNDVIGIWWSGRMDFS